MIRGIILWALWLGVLALGWGNTAQGQCETDIVSPSDGVNDDRFGGAVAISGNTMVVGARNKGNAAGAAYVFVRGANGWQQQQKLMPIVALQIGDNFGAAVAIDGDVLGVGATPFDPNFGATGKGYVRVFRRNGATWTEETVNSPPQLTNGDQFGTSVSMQGDTMLVGAPEASYPFDPNIARAGRAYVIHRNPTTSTWGGPGRVFELVASDGGTNHAFGTRVQLHGNTAFISAPGDPVDPIIRGFTGTGSVYVFELQGPSWTQAWTQVGKITPPDIATLTTATTARNFGTSMHTDGNVLIIGDAVTKSQRAYIYRLAGNTWTHEATLRNPAHPTTGTIPGDLFGVAVAIRGDLALVGAPSDDDNGLSNSGTVFPFLRIEGVWTLQPLIYGSNPQTNGRVGRAIFIDGDYGAVGAAAQAASPSIIVGPGAVYVLATATGEDCDFNGVSDECELHANPSADINGDGVLDACECEHHEECLDPYPCTLDYCDFAAGQCRHVVNPGQCLIDGLCLVDGTPNLDNECQACVAAQAPNEWTIHPDQTPCTPDQNECTSDVCVSGVCRHWPTLYGAPCGDAGDSICDRPDTCDFSGSCRPNYAAVGTVCPNSVFCDGVEHCDGQGACLSPGDPCAATPRPFCDESNDRCFECPPIAACDDGNVCTIDGCAVDGLCVYEGVDAGTPCGDPLATECSLPDACDGQGVCSPQNQPDGTICTHDADPCTFDVCVAGACVHPYENPIGHCGPADCNCNAVADECDIAVGTSNDCDENEMPDECDLPLFVADSGPLSPIGAGSPQEFVILSPRRATEDVTLAFTARGDFLSPLEKVYVSINATAVGQVFVSGAHDCPAVPDTEVLVIPAAMFNQAVGGTVGNSAATIYLTPSVAVDAGLCTPPSFIKVTVTYRGVQNGDCNGNGEPDPCEIAAGASDCNHNGVPDICDPDCDGDGVPDSCALHSPNPADANCNFNQRPDRCDVIYGFSDDCNANLVPDECEPDCQGNGVADECDIADGTSEDCNDDLVPDECPTPTLNWDAYNLGFDVYGDEAIVASYDSGRKYVEIYQFRNAIWTLETSFDLHFFSTPVAIQGGVAAVGSTVPSRCPGGTSCLSAIRIFRRDSVAGWHEEALLPLSPEFITRYLKMDLFGENLVLSDAYRSCAGDAQNNEQECGAVEVFHYANGAWTLENVLVSEPLMPFSHFGNAIAVDGDWLAVGHQIAKVDEIIGAGRVYLYRRENNAWVLFTVLGPAEVTGRYFFGYRVALQDNLLIVSAPGVRSEITGEYGVLYCFEFENGAWVQTAKIMLPGDPSLLENPSTIVLDDPYVAVGAPNVSWSYFLRGTIVVLRRNDRDWEPLAQVMAPSADYPNYAQIGVRVGMGGSSLFYVDETQVTTLHVADIWPPACHCPPGPVTFVDPPNGVIDARQPFDLDEPLVGQLAQEITVAQDEHSGVDCWTLGPRTANDSAGNLVDGVAYNGDGTYSIALARTILRGANYLIYTDSDGHTTNGQFFVHPGNVDGGPFADADDVMAHLDCCLGANSCGPEYDKHRCDINRSGSVSAEDLIREIDLLNGAGAF